MTTPQYPSGPPEPDRRAESLDASGAVTPGASSWPPPRGHPGVYGYSSYPSHPGINGFAIASLVLGIIWLWWIGSILALVFGYIARKQIRERGQSGDGLAVAGIVLGWVGVGFLALILLSRFLVDGSWSPMDEFRYAPT